MAVWLRGTKCQTTEIYVFGIAMGRVVTWPWLFQTRHFWRFGAAATTPYVVRSTIGLHSDSDVSLIFLAHIRCGKFTTGRCIVRPPNTVGHGSGPYTGRFGLYWVKIFPYLVGRAESSCVSLYESLWMIDRPNVTLNLLNCYFCSCWV